MLLYALWNFVKTIRHIYRFQINHVFSNIPHAFHFDCWHVTYTKIMTKHFNYAYKFIHKKVTWVAVRGEVSHFSTEVDISINCWSGPRLTLVVARWHCYRWLWLQNQFSQWSQNLTQSQTIMKTSFVLKDVPDLSLSYCKETTYSYYSTYNWKN